MMNVPPTSSATKHAAIERAAMALFLRDGYDRTSVDAIAAEAGVSKRTVYSHFGDKENLFLATLRDTRDDLRDRVGEIIEQTMVGTDARSALLACVRQIAEVSARSPERSAMIRLLITAIPQFPKSIDVWRQRSVSPLLEAGLERLAKTAPLAIDDFEEAAGHLSALTIGQINNRSIMGTIPLSDADTEAILTSGVDVFLRAYG
jgi:TetR/AcrR family transcriptional regulator, mexJK operon transcriptional repressor